DLLFLIQTESFTHQPVAVLCLIKILLMKRLVAQKSQTLPIAKTGLESKLLCLLGADIEKTKGYPQPLQLAAVFYHMKPDPVIKIFRQPPWQQLHTKGTYQLLQLPVAVYMKFFFIGRSEERRVGKECISQS